MYKLFTTIFLIFLFIKAYSQNEIFNKNIGWKEGAFSSIKTFFIKDKIQEKYCVLLNDTARIKGFLFDSTMNLGDEFEVYGLEHEDIIGGYIHKDKILIFTKKKKSSSIKNLVFNLTDKNAVIYEIPFKPKDDKFIGQINHKDAFLYVTANKKLPLITVFRFSENHVDSLVYNLGNLDSSLKNDLWQTLTKKETGSDIIKFSRSSDVAIVQPDLESSIEDANSPNKIYLEDDRLLLTIDKVRGETMLYYLNLNKADDISFKTITREIPPPAPSSAIFSPQFNSFVLGKLIYYVDVDLNKLRLNIHDINTGKELSKFEAKASENITFKNTPVMQEGSLYTSKPRELSKTIQLLRKITNGRAVVTAIENSGNHEVTIGAFKEVKQSGGGMMMGAGFGGPMYVSYGVGFALSWNKLTRFKSLFNPQTGAHINGEIGLSAYEKLQNFIEETDIPKKSINVFSLNGKYYLSSYTEEPGDITITEFVRDN